MYLSKIAANIEMVIQIQKRFSALKSISKN